MARASWSRVAKNQSSQVQGTEKSEVTGVLSQTRAKWTQQHLTPKTGRNAALERQQVLCKGTWDTFYATIVAERRGLAVQCAFHT